MKKNNPFIKLIGVWQTTGKVVTVENADNVALHGTDSYELILNGQYILHKADVWMGDERNETFELIKFEEEKTSAEMHYYNSKAESGIMTATLNNNDFIIDSDNLKFHGKLTTDDTLITGKWQMKSASGEWKEFIELELRKNN